MSAAAAVPLRTAVVHGQAATAARHHHPEGRATDALSSRRAHGLAGGAVAAAPLRNGAAAPRRTSCIRRRAAAVVAQGGDDVGDSSSKPLLFSHQREVEGIRALRDGKEVGPAAEATRATSGGVAVQTTTPASKRARLSINVQRKRTTCSQLET